jgi:hypothetical protein
LVATAFAQDRSVADPSVNARKEWYSLAQGRTDFEVSDAALMPGQLALVAEQSGCRYKEDIKSTPVRFLQLRDRRLAIVFCPDVIGSHRVFDLSDLRKPPTPVQFPFFAQPDGFGTTTRPGWITQEKETNVFQAVTGSDFMPSERIRHTYRFDGFPMGFVIVRVDVSQDRVGEWTTIWDAPRWSFPAKSK